MSILIEQTKQAVSEGYGALRMVAEATFSLGSSGLFKKLIYYENIINEGLFPKYPFKSLCVYDKSIYPPEIIKAAIQAHPILFYNGELFLQNIHYIPPEVHFDVHEKKFFNISDSDSYNGTFQNRFCQRRNDR
jgi:hypothetical protein